MRSRFARDSDVSHLRPCPDCGAANGFNAPLCWSCESALLPTPQTGIRPAPSHATAPVRDRVASGEASGVEDVGSGTLSQAGPKDDVEMRAAALAQSLETLRSGSARMRRRRRLAAAAIALTGIALIGIGYPIFRQPEQIRIEPTDLPDAVRPPPRKPVAEVLAMPAAQASIAPTRGFGSCGTLAATTAPCPP